VQSFALSPDGRSIAWIGRDPVDHLRVRVALANGSQPRTLLELHPFVDRLRTSQVEEFDYRSRDGLELPALLVKPLGYRPGQRYPLIAQIHGGGFSSRFELDGTISPGTGPLEWQLWAAKGYAMVITDYRITGTYGRSVILDTIKRQDYYDRDCDDALGAVDYAIARGIADTLRLGVFGFSYGGTHTNFMITYTHRFKAAISYEGWGDEFMKAGFPDAACPTCIYFYGGAPWNVPVGYFRESSIFQVKGVRTATMFVSGDPTAGSEPREDNVYLYVALRDQGVPSELLQYDDEGHGLSKAVDQQDVLRRAVAWFHDHLMH
jgi:dipeptidyl aminopeptidase/acylaminoacyl peptidase